MRPSHRNIEFFFRQSSVNFLVIYPMAPIQKASGDIARTVPATNTFNM